MSTASSKGRAAKKLRTTSTDNVSANSTDGLEDGDASTAKRTNSGLATDEDYVDDDSDKVSSYGEGRDSDSGSNSVENATVARMRQGRWTASEHHRFVKGVRVYGQGRWSAISKIVGTRTTEQTRSHGQKHEMRAKRAGVTFNELLGL